MITQRTKKKKSLIGGVVPSSVLWLRISKKRNQRPFIGTRENVAWSGDNGSDRRAKVVFDHG
jgi:hypothetical protein